MINSVYAYPISTLLNGDNNIVYHIPRYQREYSWGKAHWESLFDDLLDNDPGYFLGSIICINQSTDSLASQQLELVDGQQRMTTVSLFLAALYSSLKDDRDQLDEDQNMDFMALKYRLMHKKSNQTRLELQKQNSNFQDYQAILSRIGLLEDIEPLSNAGNRRVFKAYRYFQQRIESFCESSNDTVEARFQLLNSINQSVLVKIEVNSHSDAYVLFESLNNRGAPLTAIDLIKNKLLAEVGKINQEKIDPAFDKWKRLLDYLTDDYAIQERFFRHYYNAFQNELRQITKIPFATRSKLMKIYEKLINHDVFGFLQDITVAGSCYSQIIGETELQNLPTLEKPLEDLEHIQGAPSYILLVFLWIKKDDLGLEEQQLKQVIQILVKFFVRRNLTDTPPTRDLDRLFVSIITNINDGNLSGQALVDQVRASLVSVSTSLDDMESALKGDLYIDNAAVARFVLCALEETSMTRETTIDLWKLDKHKKYVWTIEHIFPQGENIPMHWVDMIAQGDKDLANEYRDKYVHQLGNLTISGFNSALGTKSFIDKRDRVDKQGRQVGYKNGLTLNRTLADKDKWSIEDIQYRTGLLASRVMELFAFDGEDRLTRGD